jgi:putative ABC transport system permease protein
MALIPSQEEMASREGFDISVVARLKSEISIEKAQTELDTIAARISSENPDTRNGWSVHAISLRQSLLGDARVPLLILFAAVGFVLLIACANVSNLFLARGWARRREFAIRSAVGATRGALLRQLAVEGILVAMMGGASAMVIAGWTLHGLRGLLPPEIPRLQEIRIDGMVAWFTLGASMLAAVCSGLAPALLSTRGDVSATIKETGAGAGGNNTRVAHNFLRQLLVVVEVALAVVLLIGATLAVRSFGRLMEVDRGFKPDHLVTLKMEFPKFRFEKPEQAIAFVRQALDGTRGIPGVETASASLVYPLSDEVAETTFQTEATVNDAKLGEQTALANRVAPQFFHAFRIPLLAGRDFNGTDFAGGAPVYIVNETLAQKYFGAVNVVGRRLSTRKESGHLIWGEIVGVAGNVTGLDPAAESKPQVYAPFFQMREASGAYLVVRCKADPGGLVPAIEERIWAVNKNEPIDAIQTLTARIAEVSAASRSQSFLLGIFGGLGLVLALLGVYGVMSYVVSLQTREIGIRMALGADRLNILRTVLAQGLKLTAAGILLGVGGGLALTRFIRSLLYGISATDPLTFVSVPLVLILIAMLACYIPARRATKIAPTIALRYE